MNLPAPLRRVAARARAADWLLASPDAEIRAIGREWAAKAQRYGERDRLLIDGRARFLPNMSNRAAAAELAAQWRRYEAAGWFRERTLDELPPSHAGRITEVFWRAMKLCPHALSAERLRRLWGDYE